MYDLFLRILRDELNTSNIIDIQHVKINEYRNYLYNALYQLSTQNTETRRYFNEIVRNILKDVDLLIRVRFLKNILGSSKPSDSVDSDFYNFIDKIIYFMKILFTNFYIGQDTNMYVIFKNKCIASNRVFSKGDLVKLDSKTCLKLYLNDCVDIVIKPYVVEFLSVK